MENTGKVILVASTLGILGFIGYKRWKKKHPTQTQSEQTYIVTAPVGDLYDKAILDGIRKFEECN